MDEADNTILDEDKPFLSCYAKKSMEETGQPILITFEGYHRILNKAKTVY